ncbi:MAG TPA: galactokinase, partial [Chloroflexota bacterium]|nr:galactokinase [Chloroflexota bacterium]
KERRRQCEDALRALAPHATRALPSLRDLEVGDLDGIALRLPQPLQNRVRHVVTENDRVRRCAQALRDDNLDYAGMLMADSHRSLRDLYEFSCPELDLLVDLAWNCPGTVGARMTGAGFGGCTVNLVRTDAIDQFRAQVVAAYNERTGKQADLFVCRAADGAKLYSL